MKINPVYQREMTVSSRSMKMPLAIALFNLLLALATFVAMAYSINAARTAGRVDYTSFIRIFKYAAALEFALVCFLMPMLTAAGISSEREHRTLELMLTTRLSPARIVLGKLEAGLSTMIVIIISSLPVTAVVFAYGGITIKDFLVMFVTFIVAAFFTAGIGIFASAVSRRTNVAMAVAYAILILVTAGVPAVIYLTGKTGGGLFNLLLINPAATFYAAASETAGNPDSVRNMAFWLGSGTEVMRPGSWIAAGLLLQTMAGAALTFFAIKRVAPSRKK